MSHCPDSPEELLPFRQIVAPLPTHFGGAVPLSTFHSWASCGLRGVRLENILLGGRRFTSLAAV